MKPPDSILGKAARIGCPLTVDDIGTNILDIAGVRVTCGLISDTYRVATLLSQHADLTVIEVEDYIAHPKPNGYKSFHMILEVPVYLSDRVERVPVELQIRTIAMDLWANLEHKIHYKHDHAVPRRLLNELIDAAEAAHRLDVKMQRLYDEVGDPTAGRPPTTVFTWNCWRRTQSTAGGLAKDGICDRIDSRNSAGRLAWCPDRLMRRGIGRTCGAAIGIADKVITAQSVHPKPLGARRSQRGCYRTSPARRRGQPRWTLHTIPARLISRGPPRRRSKHDLPHSSHKSRREAAHVRTNSVLPDRARAPIGNR